VKEIELEDTNVSIIRTKEEGSALFFTDDKKRFREFIFINYCPICGRDLTMEEGN